MQTNKHKKTDIQTDRQKNDSHILQTNGSKQSDEQTDRH